MRNVSRPKIMVFEYENNDLGELKAKRLRQKANNRKMGLSYVETTVPAGPQGQVII
jgi:hypothetical protein